MASPSTVSTSIKLEPSSSTPAERRSLSQRFGRIFSCLSCCKRKYPGPPSDSDPESALFDSSVAFDEDSDSTLVAETENTVSLYSPTATPLVAANPYSSFRSVARRVQFLACGHFRQGQLLKQRYCLIRPLGEGSYSHVVLAEDTQTRDYVAVKIAKRCLDGKTVRELPEDYEAERHYGKKRSTFPLFAQGTVGVHDAFIEKGHAFLVCDLLEKTVYQALKEKRIFSEEELLRYASFLGGTLASLHEEIGGVHRDISSPNVGFKGEDPYLYLFDFGNSPLPDTATEPSPTHYVATRWYRAPESMFHPTEYSSASDMWAVGCLLAEMALGRPLLRSANVAEHIHMLQSILGRAILPPATMKDNTVYLIGSRESLTNKPPSPWESPLASLPFANRSRHNNRFYYSSDFLAYRPPEETLGRVKQRWSRLQEEFPRLFLLIQSLLQWDPKKRSTANALKESAS